MCVPFWSDLKQRATGCTAAELSSYEVWSVFARGFGASAIRESATTSASAWLEPQRLRAKSLRLVPGTFPAFQRLRQTAVMCVCVWMCVCVCERLLCVSLVKYVYE